MSWGVADQAVSSLTNFAVGTLAARQCGPAGFGVFSIAWVTFACVLNISRGMATDPLMVRFGGAVGGSGWRSATRAALAVALAVGVALGLLCAALGLLIGGSIGPALLVLGLVLPGVLAQDAWRYSFLADGRGDKAFVNDAICAAALVLLLVPAVRAGTPVTFLLAWGTSALVGAAAGIAQSGLSPRPSAAAGWLRDQGDLGSRYTFVNLTVAGASQAITYGLGAIVGVAAIGAMRGAAQLFGPLSVLMLGLSMVTVAEGVNLARRSPHRLRRFFGLIGLGQAIAVACWGIPLLVLPPHLGRLLLGPLWTSVTPLILPTMLFVLVGSFSGAANSGLRVLGAARRSVRAEVIAAIVVVAAALGGAAIGGLRCAAWAGFLAQTGATAVWWRELNAALRERVDPVADDLKPRSDAAVLPARFCI